MHIKATRNTSDEVRDTSDEVRDTLNAEFMLEEDNVVQTTQEDFQLPPYDHQEETKGHEAHVKMPNRPGDMI